MCAWRKDRREGGRKCRCVHGGRGGREGGECMLSGKSCAKLYFCSSLLPPSSPTLSPLPLSLPSHLSDIVDKFSGEVSRDAGEVGTLHLCNPLTWNGEG